MDSLRVKKQQKGKPISADNLSKLTKSVTSVSGVPNKRAGQSIVLNPTKRYRNGIIYVSYNSHSGKIYSGYQVDKNTGDISTITIEFIFQNDDGDNDLLDVGDEIACKKAPAYIANDTTNYNWTVTNRYVAVSSPPEGGGGTFTIIKYDGTRSDKRYTGHIWTGEQGDLVEFRFLNDPGTDTLLNSSDYVMGIPCPDWDEDNEIWSGDYDKYLAILSPWSALA